MMILSPTERNAATQAAAIAHAADPAIYADPLSGNHFSSYAAYLKFRADNPWFAELYPAGRA